MEYALVQDREVYAVMRKDHYGDKSLWLVCSLDPNTSQRLSYVRADWCEVLDPALYILFERKVDD
jgi:hypothetical protein